MYKHTLATALLLLASASACAQFAWIGPNGTRQYSDKPPPPGTPASKILKAPGMTRTLAVEPDTGPVAVPVAVPVGAPVKADAPKPDAAKGPQTVAQREAAYQERMKAKAEEEQKAQQEAQQQQKRADACASARSAQAELASGMRMGKVDQNGERGYMNDAERAERAQRVNQALENCR